jgi:hypothetical protein
VGRCRRIWSRARWLTRFGIALGVLVAVALTSATASVPRAGASTPPNAPWSFYMKTTTRGAAETLGINQCKANNSHSRASYNDLDFGKLVNNTGAQEDFSTQVLSQTTILSVTEWFVHGYALTATCSPSYRLNLSIGTNNYHDTLSKAKGIGFGKTIKRFYDWVKQYSLTSKVQVYGAIDAEGAWDPYSQVTAWYSGYATAAGIAYIDDGAATGCPTYKTFTHPTCKVKAPTPTYGWTMGDYYNVSWRFGLAFLTPQIYFTGQATQWRWISTYGSSFSGQIQPYGPMITPGYLSASTAWNDLQAYFPGIAYILTIRSE